MSEVTRQKLDSALRRAADKATNLNSDLKAAIFRQQRYPSLLTYMVKEYAHYRVKVFSRGKIATVDKFATGALDLIISTCELESRNRNETKLAKSERDQRAKKIDDFDKTLKGEVTGDFIDILKPSDSEEQDKLHHGQNDKESDQESIKKSKIIY